MNLVYGQDAVVAEWIRAHGPHAEVPFDKCATIGVEEGGRLIAGAVFTEYRPHSGSIHLSGASVTPRWATRKTLHALFAYPFLQLKVKRLTAYTGFSMSSVRQFLERLGFVQEGILRAGYADDDCVVYGMLREECRWVMKGIGHAKQPLPAACS